MQRFVIYFWINHGVLRNLNVTIVVKTQASKSLFCVFAVIGVEKSILRQSASDFAILRSA